MLQDNHPARPATPITMMMTSTMMTIHNNVGVQKLQEGHVDQAMYAFQRALVVAKQGVKTRDTRIKPTTGASTPDLQFSWESLEQSVSLFTKNGPQQQQCQDDDWESFDQQHQIHAQQQAIRLVDPRRHCYCGHGTKADDKIRSGIIIFNLALCFHLQSMMDYASSSHRSSLRRKAQKLYRNALILMSKNDNDDNNIPGPTACLQDVVALLIVSNTSCLSANDLASQDDLGLLVTNIHRRSYWDSLPVSLALKLDSLIEACQWQSTFEKIVSVQAAAAA